MAIKRLLKEHLLYLAGKYPIITITGPRQSGKTTLAKMVFPKKAYVNLEKLDIREMAEVDPNAFLEEYPNGAIIDEIQRVPKLLSYLQVLVDERKETGLFIITGSQNFELMKHVSQSLAGRTGLVKLLPLSLQELKKVDKAETNDWAELIYKGFYPRIYSEDMEPSIYYADYIQTYLERDLRDLTAVHDLRLFRNFLKLCAARIGQCLNYKNIADDLGVAQNTVKNWINLLEVSYIIFLLPPYFANIKKQITKSPKLYFTDPALAASLLDNESAKHVKSHPLFGSLFENLVIMEFVKYRFNQGKQSNHYFYQDRTHEIDLVSKVSDKLISTEIKSAKTFHESFFRNLDYFESIFQDQLIKKAIVYGGEKSQNRSKASIINPWDITKFSEEFI